MAGTCWRVSVASASRGGIFLQDMHLLETRSRRSSCRASSPCAREASHIGGDADPEDRTLGVSLLHLVRLLAWCLRSGPRGLLRLPVRCCPASCPAVGRDCVSVHR